MSLTKIGSIGINTGIAFAGVTTIVTLNTANDALSIGATVNVGSGITLGASGDIFATGVSTFSGNLKVGSGVTISPDGDGFYTGVVTATTFSGALAASSLTGALPAISGANLTNLDASDLASGTVPTARLGSGTASSSTFLRGDSTFQTVVTDLVNDTSPQLGGDLDTNSHHILLDDDHQIRFGDSNDFNIQHNTDENYIQSNSGHIYIRANVDDDEGDNIYIQAKSGEDSIVCNDDGAVELYHDNTKRFETSSGGGTLTGDFTVTGNIYGGNHITIQDSDGASDMLKIGASEDLRIYHYNNSSYIRQHTDKPLYIGGTSTGQSLYIQPKDGENSAIFKPNGAVELYHDNVKKLQTNSTYGTILSNTTDDANFTNALLLTRRGYETSGYGVALQPKGGSIASQNGLRIAISDGGGSTYNSRFAFTNDGLCFNSDTAAANALDDYEEGTFTPVLDNSLTISSYTAQVGHYTKIGNQVFGYVYLLATSSSSDSNSLRVSGLPFTSNSIAYHEGGGYITYLNGTFGTSGVELQAKPWVPQNQTYVLFHTPEDGNNLRGNETNFANKYLIFHIRYKVA